MSINNFAEITKKLPVMEKTDVILNDDAENDISIEGKNILRKVGYVAKELGVTPNRVNYLLSIYHSYLNVCREDNIEGRSKILFHASDIEKLRRINSLSKDQGLNATQIKLILTKGNYVPEVKEQEEETLPALLTKGSEENVLFQELLEEIIANAIENQLPDLQLMGKNTEIIKSQNDEIAKFMDEIRTLNARIEEKDNQILKLLEQQKQAQEEQNKKKGFWPFKKQ